MEPHLQRRYSESAIYSYTNERSVPPGDVLLAAALAAGISLDEKLGIVRHRTETGREIDEQRAEMDELRSVVAGLQDRLTGERGQLPELQGAPTNLASSESGRRARRREWARRSEPSPPPQSAPGTGWAAGIGGYDRVGRRSLARECWKRWSGSPPHEEYASMVRTSKGGESSEWLSPNRREQSPGTGRRPRRWCPATCCETNAGNDAVSGPDAARRHRACRSSWGRCGAQTACPRHEGEQRAAEVPGRCPRQPAGDRMVSEYTPGQATAHPSRLDASPVWHGWPTWTRERCAASWPAGEGRVWELFRLCAIRWGCSC
jgi:hypothetical protein